MQNKMKYEIYYFDFLPSFLCGGGSSVNCDAIRCVCSGIEMAKVVEMIYETIGGNGLIEVERWR